MNEPQHQFSGWVLHSMNTIFNFLVIWESVIMIKVFKSSVFLTLSSLYEEGKWAICLYVSQFAKTHHLNIAIKQEQTDTDTEHKEFLTQLKWFYS